jgi:hypothetical protein
MGAFNLLISVAELTSVLASNSNVAVAIYAIMDMWIGIHDSNFFYQASSFFSV